MTVLCETVAVGVVLEVDCLLSSATLHIPEPLCDGSIVGCSFGEDTSSNCKMEGDEKGEDGKANADRDCSFGNFSSTDDDASFDRVAVRAFW